MYICVCVCVVFFFDNSIYSSSFFFNQIFFNLSFLMTLLEKIPRATTERNWFNYHMEKVQLQNWLQPQATNSLNKINITVYFENLTVNYMFFTLLIHMSIFVSIGCYLPYNLQSYISCMILNYKNLQFKNLLMTQLLIFNFLEILQI